MQNFASHISESSNCTSLAVPEQAEASFEIHFVRTKLPHWKSVASMQI
jgi:hypothetical protein